MTQRSPHVLRRLRDHPERREDVEALGLLTWPEFLQHSDVRGWSHLYTTFADSQILVLSDDDRLIAAGHTVAIPWTGVIDDLPETINGIVQRAIRAHVSGEKPTWLAALAAMIHPDHRGSGLSTVLMRAMTDIAAQSGLGGLIAPVRPTWKERHPAVLVDEYTGWLREDGAPYDPWIRVHWKMGAEFLRILDRAMTVEGSIADWEKWTGLRFPESGEYDVPGALRPVRIDRSTGTGIYVEPNVWMIHRSRLS